MLAIPRSSIMSKSAFFIKFVQHFHKLIGDGFRISSAAHIIYFMLKHLL
jgi:hypothetical protein